MRTPIQCIPPCKKLATATGIRWARLHCWGRGAAAARLDENVAGDIYVKRSTIALWDADSLVRRAGSYSDAKRPPKSCHPSTIID